MIRIISLILIIAALLPCGSAWGADAETVKYGAALGATISDTVDKTGKWISLGAVTVTYSPSFSAGHSYNIAVRLRELTAGAAVAPADMDDLTIYLKGTLPAVSSPAAFAAAIPSMSLDVAGKTSIAPGTDIACVVTSTSTRSKTISLYIKSKAGNTHYEVLPENSRGRGYSSINSSDIYAVYAFSPNSPAVSALPSPVQGSVVYGAWRKTPAAQLDIATQDISRTTYTTTTAAAAGYYRIATIPISTAIKQAKFIVKAYISTGTVTESTVTVNLAYNSANYSGQGSGVVANTSHSYNSDTDADPGWVLRYVRVSFDASYAYIDVYKSKAVAATIETTPVTQNDWTWATGSLTVNPTVGAYKSTTAYLSYGLAGNSISANSATVSTYTSYGVEIGRSLANTVDKTGQWEYIGNIYLPYDGTYRYGQAINTEIKLKELTSAAAVAPADLEDITLHVKVTMPTVADSAAFNSAIPSIAIDVTGKTSLAPATDIAALVYSTSTGSKYVRLYYKYKASNTHYSILPQNRYGQGYSSGYAGTANVYFNAATQAAAVASLPTPAQGSIVYGAWRKTPAAQLDISKADVGLGNVDNTADTDKPVSTAQLTALNNKLDTSNPVITGTLIIGSAGIDATSAIVATQYDVTSSTVPGDVTDLSLNLKSGKTYSFTAYLRTSSGTAGGVKVAVNGTVTAANIIYDVLIFNGGAVTQGRGAALGASVGVTSASSAFIVVTGTITTSSSGTLKIQFAQNASSATASSVLVGSSMAVSEVSSIPANGGTAVLATQYDATSATTLADVDALQIATRSSTKYKFSATLFTTSSAAGGVKVAIGGTNGITVNSIVYDTLIYSAGTVTQGRSAALGTATGLTATTVSMIRIEGYVHVNLGTTCDDSEESGNCINRKIGIQFAQNASSANASSILVGSTFQMIPQ
jgi:hypothetical protein